MGFFYIILNFVVTFSHPGPIYGQVGGGGGGGQQQQGGPQGSNV